MLMKDITSNLNISGRCQDQLTEDLLSEANDPDRGLELSDL